MTQKPKFQIKNVFTRVRANEQKKNNLFRKNCKTLTYERASTNLSKKEKLGQKDKKKNRSEGKSCEQNVTHQK